MQHILLMSKPSRIQVCLHLKEALVDDPVSMALLQLFLEQLVLSVGMSATVLAK
jgi:hypothetical protein